MLHGTCRTHSRFICNHYAIAFVESTKEIFGVAQVSVFDHEDSPSIPNRVAENPKSAISHSEPIQNVTVDKSRANLSVSGLTAGAADLVSTPLWLTKTSISSNVDFPTCKLLNASRSDFASFTLQEFSKYSQARPKRIRATRTPVKRTPHFVLPATFAPINNIVFPLTGTSLGELIGLDPSAVPRVSYGS